MRRPRGESRGLLRLLLRGRLEIFWHRHDAAVLEVVSEPAPFLVFRYRGAGDVLAPQCLYGHLEVVELFRPSFAVAGLEYLVKLYGRAEQAVHILRVAPEA